MTKPFFETDEALAAKIDEYFSKCDEGEPVQVVRKGEVVTLHKAVPYTVPGLAYFLGYANRQSLWAVGQNPTHRDTVSRAMTRIESQRLVKALVGEQMERFAQFDLVNNFGYKSSTSEITVNATVAQVSDDELEQRIAALEHKMRPELAIPCGPIIDCEPQPRLLNPNNAAAFAMEQKDE